VKYVQLVKNNQSEVKLRSMVLMTCSVCVLQDAEDLTVIESERLAVEGYNAAKREQYAEAIEYFTKAIRIVRNDHRFYGNRSFCYCQLGQYSK
jgi:Flp pilus assembly protein TadD